MSAFTSIQEPLFVAPIAVTQPQDFTPEVSTVSQSLNVENASASVEQERTDQPTPSRNSTRVPRGTNPDGDFLTTRHHAICIAGVLADLANGGYDNARVVEAGPAKPVRPSKVHVAMAQICPWSINADYLNFQGSSVLAKKGLQRCFKEWIANRVYYFAYELPHSSEHPARRRRGISSIYKLFYDTFVSDIQHRRVISEEQAKVFWFGVSAKVPFRWPELAETKSQMVNLDQEEVGHE